MIEEGVPSQAAISRLMGSFGLNLPGEGCRATSCWLRRSADGGKGDWRRETS
jgi:hypothetical protein